MIPFAVTIKGVTEEGRAAWVLAVDPTGERILTSYADQSLHWVPLTDCRFVRYIQPGEPIAVIPVQPQPKEEPKIMMPDLKGWSRDGPH